MQEPPGPTYPAYLNLVLGYRTWRLDPLSGTLGSVGMMGMRWPAREAIVSEHSARGYKQNHCQPGIPCKTCGIYALDSYRSVEQHQRQQHGGMYVRGIVAGWGIVHLCSRGWRAGKAYPLALLDWQVGPARVEQGHYWHTVLYLVAERYGIPVVADLDALEYVARAAGAVPLSEW